MDTVSRTWHRLYEKSVDIDDHIIYGDIDKNDYMYTTLGGNKIATHRVAYMYHNQLSSIDDTLVVRHLCSYKGCIARDHQTIGTQSNNNYEDKIASGTLYSAKDLAGNIITEAVALAIKHSRYSRDDALYKSQKERAQMFNVRIGIVRYIDIGRSWSHLPDRDGFVKGNLDFRIKNRTQAKESKNKLWTEADFDKALDYIKQNSVLSTDKSYENTACMLWAKGKDKKGYGIVYFNGVKSKAHILGCQIAAKRLKKNDEITRHLCNQKDCCNPLHLKFGTLSDNAIDAIVAGSKTAKLTEEIIKKILEDVKTMSQRKVAFKYGIAPSNVSFIVSGKTWKHVTR
jgi:hypothetical protein